MFSWRGKGRGLETYHKSHEIRRCSRGESGVWENESNPTRSGDVLAERVG